MQNFLSWLRAFLLRPNKGSNKNLLEAAETGNVSKSKDPFAKKG
jgi:hypothetical protein